MRLVRIVSIALACGAAAYALPPAAHAGWDPMARQERFCSDEKFSEKFAEMQKRQADRLAERLKLNEAQKTAYKDVQALRAKTFADNRAVQCAAKPMDMSFDKRLEFRQARLQARLDALKTETPKLLAFYNSLDERQKGQFDEISRHGRGRHGAGPGCGGPDRDMGHMGPDMGPDMGPMMGEPPRGRD